MLFKKEKQDLICGIMQNVEGSFPKDTKLYRLMTTKLGEAMRG